MTTEENPGNMPAPKTDSILKAGGGSSIFEQLLQSARGGTDCVFGLGSGIRMRNIASNRNRNCGSRSVCCGQDVNRIKNGNFSSYGARIYRVILNFCRGFRGL
jgi:hypothetical protein